MGRRFSNRRLINSRTLIIYSRLYTGGRKAAFPQVYTFAVAPVGGRREAVWGGGFLTAGI